jgi:hypothetical protein
MHNRAQNFQEISNKGETQKQVSDFTSSPPDGQQTCICINKIKKLLADNPTSELQAFICDNKIK